MDAPNDMSDAGNPPTSQRDLFDALADSLREQIRSGGLPPGNFLPSEAELARAAGTKRYSIRRALARLQDQGLIEPISGRGWVVTDANAASGTRLPRYRQIAVDLRAAVGAGELVTGAALPSEADLIARYGVSRGTVRQALAVLEADGVISTQPGKGRYVR